MTILTTLTPTVGNTLVPPWAAEQEPQVRGVYQNRITAVGGTDVPGSGVYKPTVATRVELRSKHAGDFAVTATAGATSGATTITLSSGDAALLVNLDWLENTRTGEILRLSGAPTGGSVPVIRGTNPTTAAAILSGDAFTVYGGDVNDSGGNYATSRAEVYGRFATSSSDAAELWPDPVGSERWYRFALYMPSDFATDPTNAKWTSVTQWKGVYGGSPPLSIEVNRSDLVIGGTRGYSLPNHNLGPAAKGSWTSLVVGMKWSPDPSIGWVSAWRDGVEVVRKTSTATMDYKVDGVTPDPLYLKQGIYRAGEWTDTHVTYTSPAQIADNSLDFGVAPSPTVVAGGEYWGMTA